MGAAGAGAVAQTDLTGHRSAVASGRLGPFDVWSLWVLDVDTASASQLLGADGAGAVTQTCVAADLLTGAADAALGLRNDA